MKSILPVSTALTAGLIACTTAWAEKHTTSPNIIPTLASVSGAPLPERKIDGVDLLVLLKGDPDANPRKSFFYYYRQNSLEAVTNGDWKLVFAHPGRTYEGYLPGKDGQPGPNAESFRFPKALYDLRRDPGERYNVMEAYPEIVAELEKLADEAREDLRDDISNITGKNRRAPGKIN